MKTIKENLFLTSLKSGLRASQIAKIFDDNNIRLSVYGWSRYAIDGASIHYIHHFGDDIYTNIVESLSDLSFYDDNNVHDFEYKQRISTAMVILFRNLL